MMKSKNISIKIKRKRPSSEWNEVNTLESSSTWAEEAAPHPTRGGNAVEGMRVLSSKIPVIDGGQEQNSVINGW